MNTPTNEQILAGAKAMHAAYEARTQQRNPFYSRVPWERLDEPSRNEFINYVRPALTAALTTHAAPHQGGVHVPKEAP